jgi:hypothetical protein
VQLNTFIADYIPLELRHGRDFTGGRGWCHLANQILRRLAAEGFCDLNFRKKLAVYADLTNNTDIPIPSDFLRFVKVTTADDEITPLDCDIVDGVLRLDEEANDPTYDVEEGVVTISDSIPAGTPVAPTTTAAVITSLGRDAVADEFNDKYLLLQDSDSAVVRITDTQLVEDAGVQYAKLIWTPALANAPLDADAVAIFSPNLYLTYFAKFTNLSSETDTIPIDDRFNSPLAYGMMWLATMASDEAKARLYYQMYQSELETIGKDLFTPSEEDARPKGVNWPGFNSESSTDDDDDDED